ncbi:right-handed parallel beta-helix repeat-containing protein [Burkholderia cenocepacia]|uniref:right-handed parallel beta-helix repeat-containing protein n=1 Tax=Burkholderia cenocepacia TaxID=95486 RepID=UPI001BAA1997|nr:right-handed parallel beta-helix repeat-containing protein [Burkholderia cenocepacia]QUO26176.1 right-handed parallel beta-helix repeat-containing protein [Burkholderia cenocepacia]
MTTGAGVRLTGFPPASGFTDTDLLFMTQSGVTVKGTVAQLRTALVANRSVETFVSGTNFTPGTTTSLTLAGSYGSINAIDVYFDGVPQLDCTLSGKTLTFNPVIPSGTQQVVVKGANAGSIGTPSDGAVDDSKLAPGSKTYNRANGMLAVVDFPMVSVSVQDDTSAVQAAFNLALHTGRPVQLPFDRDVYITRPIDLKPMAPPSTYSGQVGIHTARANAILLQGQGGRAIKAAPNFSGQYMLQLIFDSTNNWIAPMWSGMQDFILDGSGVVDTALISNYCMNVQLRRMRATGVNTAFQWIGYGVAEIDRCQAFAGTCIDMSQGGGDSFIQNCDFYPTANGVLIGPSGGDLSLRDTVFTRQDADFPSSSQPIAVASTITATEFRDIRVRNCEFAGMLYGVSLSGSGGQTVKRVVIEGCHTTPSAGGALWTGSLALIKNAQEIDISGNFVGYPGNPPTNGTPLAGVGLVNCNNVGIRGNQFSYLTAPAVIATSCSGLNINDNRLNNVAMTDGTWTALYLQNVTNSTVSINTAQKTQPTAGQVFITELGTSTGNKGVGNNATGFTTFASLAPGSTSTYS